MPSELSVVSSTSGLVTRGSDGNTEILITNAIRGRSSLVVIVTVKVNANAAPKSKLQLSARAIYFDTTTKARRGVIRVRA